MSNMNLFINNQYNYTLLRCFNVLDKIFCFRYNIVQTINNINYCAMYY